MPLRWQQTEYILEHQNYLLWKFKQSLTNVCLINLQIDQLQMRRLLNCNNWLIWLYKQKQKVSVQFFLFFFLFILLLLFFHYACLLLCVVISNVHHIYSVLFNTLENIFPTLQKKKKTILLLVFVLTKFSSFFTSVSQTSVFVCFDVCFGWIITSTHETISFASKSGTSIAAKWPPLSGWL